MPKNKYRPSILHRPLLITVALAVVLLLVTANISTTHNFTPNTSSVLGEGEESEEQKQAEEAAKESAKQAEEIQKESTKQAEELSKQQQEQQKETVETTPAGSSRPSSLSVNAIKSKTETISPSGLKMKTETEGSKQETEIETADGQKIKTKIEDDGTTKIEIENGTLKLVYRMENGQLALRVEDEEGDEVEIEDDELDELENEVENELGDDDLKLTPTTNNQLALTSNRVAAITGYPLSINVETKQLTITTPQGQRVVTVLPDEAVANLLATGLINQVESTLTDTDIQGELGALSGVVGIDIRDGEIVYKIDGVKTHRLLGLIPVDTQTTAFVSADTGTVVAQERSILANIIDFLSPTL